MKPSTFLFALLFSCTSFIQAQDCDILVQPRPVPNSNDFVYSTNSYTMATEMGAVTITALTADNVVALVFNFARAKETCLDEKSNIQIRFSNGNAIVMANAVPENCDGKFALYFGDELRNLSLLHLFRTKNIRFAKVTLKNGRSLKINLAQGMAYNLRRSLDCLSTRIGVGNPHPSELSSQVVDFADSIQASSGATRPEFEGGDDGLRTFFGRNMRTLSIVDRGVVMVSFVIKSDGSVTDPKVIRGVSEKVDEEARRLVSIMPKWKPAYKNGTAVPARWNVLIRF